MVREKAKRHKSVLPTQSYEPYGPKGSHVGNSNNSHNIKSNKDNHGKRSFQLQGSRRS